MARSLSTLLRCAGTGTMVMTMFLRWDILAADLPPSQIPMNAPDKLCRQVVLAAQPRLPPLEAGSWDCQFVEKHVLKGIGTSGYTGSVVKIDPAAIVAESPMIASCRLSSSANQWAYIVPFLWETSRLLMIGDPIPLAQNDQVLASMKVDSMTGRYTDYAEVVTFISQSQSCVWVVLRRSLPSRDDHQDPTSTYEIYRLVHDDAQKHAEYTAVAGFEFDRRAGVSYSFAAGRLGNLEIVEQRYTRIDGERDETHFKHLVWDGQHFVPRIP